MGYNITWNDSKITKLTATYNPEYQGIDAGTNQKHQINEQPNTFYLFQQVYDKDGKAIQNAFVDRDGNGKITEADRYLTGKSPMAKVFMGLSSEFTYRNWDLGYAHQRALRFIIQPNPLQHFLGIRIFLLLLGKIRILIAGTCHKKESY